MGIQYCLLLPVKVLVYYKLGLYQMAILPLPTYAVQKFSTQYFEMSSHTSLSDHSVITVIQFPAIYQGVSGKKTIRVYH